MSNDDAAWWREGVLYQIYVRSFADADGDGSGDLQGVIDHLDHLEWLGVDGIWLSPITPSPDRDWGYDVSDYRDVHPELGDLATLDRLVADAASRGIRVILDLVPNHTSDLHPWFVDARSSVRRRASRLVRLARPTARRLAAQQLALDLRRAGVGARRADRPVLPAQLPGGAAGSGLVERGRAPRVRGDPPVLVRPRDRRVPHRRGERPHQGPRAARQPRCDGRRSRGRPPPRTTPGPQHEPPRGARDLPRLARDRRRVRSSSGPGRRDLDLRPPGGRPLLR